MAHKLRKTTGNVKIKAPIELQAERKSNFIITSLTRPVSMLCFEPLVYLNCLYIAFLYALLYFYFECYPIIFEGEPSNHTENRLSIDILLQVYMDSARGNLPLPLHQVSYPPLSIILSFCFLTDMNSSWRRSCTYSTCPYLLRCIL